MNGAPTFDAPAPPGTINFGIGQPSPDLLPVELVRRAGESFFNEARPLELNYGEPAGDERFLDALASFLTGEYGAPVSPASLFLTGGSSQALDLVATTFATAGDTVFVEEPSYFLAFQILRDHGLELVGVPTDERGMRLDVLEGMLRDHSPAFVYTIPSYHNPGGHCMSEDRRARLLRLSRDHGFLIVADEVYQLLHYAGDPPPAIGTMAEEGTVLSLGSFSKILAPGMRLGWIQSSPDLRARLSENGFVSSGGSISHFSSHVVRRAMDLGLQQEHVKKLRRAYRSRLEVMDEALRSHFSDLVTWQRPEGGYFFWLRLSQEVDTTHLRERARELKTGFQPGALFSVSGGFSNFLRLSFAHYGEEDIREGIERLRRVFG